MYMYHMEAEELREAGELAKSMQKAKTWQRK